MNESSCDLKTARKAFSRIGLALCAILAITMILQVIWFYVPMMIWGEDNWMTASSWGMWIGSFAPLYLVAIPVGLLILRKLPAQTPAQCRLRAKDFLVFIPICFCLMYGGNLIGTVLSMLLSGGSAENAIVDYVMDSNPLKVIVVVILAPLLEEYVCRKQIIDRTGRYGEKTAVFLSALTFGLLHQNLFQFFYAFALGWVFGYIYIRTGRLRYTVLLHGMINFVGSVIAPWILTRGDMDGLMTIDPNMTYQEMITLVQKILPGLILLMLYTMALLGLAIAGLVLLILKSRKLIWKSADAQLPKGTAVKTVYLNLGMVLYVLICVVFMIISLL